MTWPSISVVIPSFNQGRFIEKVLLSILRQDYAGKIQVIVSDGGSTDDTVSILRRYSDRITWWSEKDNGYADGVNKGLRRAQGDVIAIQSSDDLYLMGAFRRAAETLALFPDAAFVTGDRVIVDENLDYLDHDKHRGIYTIGSIFERLPPQDSTFARADVVQKAGGLSTEVDFIADHLFWIKCLCFGVGMSVNQFQSAHLVYRSQRTSALTRRFAEGWSKVPSILLQEEAFPACLKSREFLARGSFDYQRFWLLKGNATAECRELELRTRAEHPHWERFEELAIRNRRAGIGRSVRAVRLRLRKIRERRQCEQALSALKAQLHPGADTGDDTQSTA